MGVNPVSNHHNAYRTNAARTEEPASRQEQAPKIGTVSKEGKDTFERQSYTYDPNANSYNSNAFNEAVNKFRAENTREPDKDPSERVYGSGVQQYEASAPVSEQETKTPVTNSEKIEAAIQALYKEPVSEERNAKISDLVRLSTAEWLKEQGIKVNTGDTSEERTDYEARLNAAINGTTSANSSTTPTPAQSFTSETVKFLTDASAKLLNGGEGLSLSELGINSENFVKKMLEAFSTGEHSSDDITTLMKQSEDLIREFAKQISDGQEPDFNSLATELTINGENRTIGRLMGN